MANPKDYEITGHNISVTLGTMTFTCISVTPPGATAGDQIDISTNQTTTQREYAPADLSEPSEITLTCVYRVEDTNAALALIAAGGGQTLTMVFGTCGNRSTAATITSTTAFLKSYEPQELTTNEMPTVSVTIGLNTFTASGGAKVS